MRHLVTFAVGIGVACGGNDYGVAKETEPNPGADRPVDLSFDVAYQEHAYGRNTSRCQVQVAFSPLADTAATMPGAHGPPPPPAGQILFPEEPGACAFSELERPEQGGDPGGDPNRESEEREEPDHSGKPGDDHYDGWQVSGDVVGPEVVWMRDDRGELLLETVETNLGGVRYELTDCDTNRFPFSRSLGLDVPDSNDPDGVHAFTVSELVAVGPRVIIDSPMLVGQDLPWHDPAKTLEVRWTLEGDDPMIRGVPYAPNVRIQILSQDHERRAPDRWLVCWPDEEGWFDIDPEYLAPVVEGREDPSVWATQVGVHTEVLGPEQLTPWGRTVQVRAHVSAGGGLNLAP